MDDTTEPLGRPPIPLRTPWAAPLLAVVGLTLIGLAGVVLRTAAPAAVDATPQVTVTSSEYEAGHSSGWHVGSGVHSVVVLTGALTVYDERCERHHVGAGDVYLGGDRAHLVRNETPDPATFAVTYARRPSTRGPSSLPPPPVTCCMRHCGRGGAHPGPV